MSSSTKQHRAPAKSTPFGNANQSSQSASRSSSRAYLQRSSMTTSLRKAKRGQTVELKRHMKISAPANTSSQSVNPYQKDSMHIKEMIQVAESIVRLCSQDGTTNLLSTSDSGSLLSLLQQMCILLTPAEDSIGISGDQESGTKLGGISNRDSSIGASYDSSMAGMAANALLSQFIDGRQQQQSTQENLALLLANALARILSTENNNATTGVPSALHSIQIQTAIAFTQLAAAEPPPPPITSFDQEQFSPYGHPQPSSSTATLLASTPTSWCHVLVHSNTALSALVQQLPMPNSSTSGTATTNFDLCEKCVWAIGNLAGDSEMAREALRQMGALPRLISCIALGITAYTSNVGATHQSLINLVRNSVWALSNFVRGGGIPSCEFLDMNDPQMIMPNQGQYPRLTRQDVAFLLSSPELLHPSLSTAVVSQTTTAASWYDVAVETCWFMLFQTSRDESTVDFFFSSEGQAECNNLMAMIATRLTRGSEAAVQRFGGSAFLQDIYKSSLCCIPCCRLLKTMAIASDGRYAQAILLAGTTMSQNTDKKIRPIESSLARIVSLGHLGAGNEASFIALEAAATAGACLYDAGYPLPHPSTNACQTLIPALCHALVHPLSKFEFQREVIWALWNAVNIPSELCDNQDGISNKNASYGRMEGVQKDLLIEIIRTSPNEVARALTNMLSSVDSEAVEASLYLVNVLLRRLSYDTNVSLRILFDEARLEDALNRICEHDTEESYTAELAAELLDDFFEDKEDALEEETTANGVSGGQFQFQAPLAIGIPEGGFNFEPGISLQQQPSQPPMGRGRGRGQVLPAWLQRQQHQ